MSFALRPLIAALNNGDGAAAAVGVAQLFGEILRIALIHFGADTGVAQILRHLLIAAKAFHIAVHDGDQHRRGGVGDIQLAEVFQRRHQARDADGEAGGGHVLAGEALDQPVIPPAAADRAELDLFALFIGDVETGARPRRPGRCNIRGLGRT